LKVRRTQVILKASSKSCRNPKNQKSAEICGTLETLGPKIKNSRNFTLRASGGALKEVVPSCPNFSPNVQVLRAGTPQKGGSYRFSGNPRRVVRFCRNEKMTGRCLCNGFFKTYALIPC
jgi:hypothetical protein